MAAEHEVTRLLRTGDREALFDVVYEQLHRMASRRMTRERADHTLQATALVHEAYLRLVEEDARSWDNRVQFFATATEVMRRILIEHARRAAATKRGGKAQRVTLGAADDPIELDPTQVLSLEDALHQLESEDPRAAAVARLRFLVGLSVAETAKALSISTRSVHREWLFARARLFDLLRF